MNAGNNRHVVIIHVHMFKNAGSTFDWSLKKNFGKAFINHRNDDQMKRGAEYLGTYLNKMRPSAISSHHVKLPLPEIRGMTLLPAFILRHPIDRIGSVYAFEKRQKADTMGAIKAKELSFSDYVRWYMEPDSPATIKDFQTRFCCGKIGAPRALEEKDYSEALKTIKKTPLVGIVDLYDESMTVFEHYLKEYFPQIDLSYKKKNVSPRQQSPLEKRISDLLAGIVALYDESVTVFEHYLKRYFPQIDFDHKKKNFSQKQQTLPLGQRISEIKNELGEDLVSLVMECNRYDLMLYEEATRLLRQRITNMINFNENLDSFRQRVLSLKWSKRIARFFLVNSQEKGF